MKRILLLITLLFPLALCAQKYACVNTEYILSNIPDYSRAQSQLDKMAANWQKELEQKFQEIDELKAKEAEARELQNKYFGPGGDLDKKRAELMKPIQDRVYNAIERIANEKSYAFILDKSGSATLLYVNAKYDVSDLVLDMLGYKPGSGSSEDKDASQPTRKKEVSNPEMRKP